MQEKGIVLNKISKSFAGVRALNNVDFDLNPGEIHVLLGENGAGKSTMIKIISGALSPDAGEIRIDGRAVHFSGPAEANQYGIATIYQELSLIPYLSVAENIFLGRQPLRRDRLQLFVDWKKMNEQARLLLSELGLYIDPRIKAGKLSVAEQQLVEIAKAISVNARFLILDEPTATLTDKEIDQLFSVVLGLSAKGVGIIYISHRLEELETVGDRITVMRDGEKVTTINLKDVTRDQLITFMVGRELKLDQEASKAKIGKVALKVNGLSRKGVFKNVSFTLREGEILGMAGLVGSRRTEVARAIFGAEPWDEGGVEVFGQRAKMWNPGSAIKMGMAFLPAERKTDGLVLSASIMKNITLSSLKEFCRCGFISARKEEKKSSEYMQNLRIKTPSIKQLCGNLSGGNQQKVALAKALCSRAKILIFDEPTRGIDIGAKFAIYELLRKLAREGTAIIIISSELPELLNMSDRILVMRAGKITGEFSREEATQEKILHAAYQD